jgi:hypothetical protein
MILHLPIGPRGENGLPGKQGPDDFIVRYGEQAFRDFIESAVNHRPVVRSLAEYRAEMVAARLDSIAHPGIYCDRSPAGAGKSFADRPAAAAAKSSLIVLPTHRNCTEVVGDYLLDGLAAVAYPQLTKETCMNYDEAIRAVQSGLSPSGALCPTCPTQMTCSYHAEMKEAGEAAHRMATHQRARLTFSTIADGCKYIAVHEDATNLIRPTAEIDAGFDKVAVVARDAKEAARTRVDMDSVHFFERMENAACIVSEHLQQAASTAPLTLPAASTAPRSVDLHLLAAMRATKTWPPADAVRITKAAASGDAELVLRVDTILTKGRELAVRRSVIAVWATKIPDHAACWFCDATANADELQTVLGRPVCDRTPAGDLERLHQIVQITTDIKKSTAPSTVLKVLRGVLAAFPEAKRIGVIAHHEHLPIVRGTAKNPEHRLDESLQGQIVKAEYFRSGEGRSSNHWIEECDLLVVLGTPRVPPPAVKMRLIQLGLVTAATREGGWEADWWSGKTTTGKRVTVRTSAYRDHDWYAAHCSIVRAELFQAIGRGRGICPNGVPVVVFSNEPLGLPLLDCGIEPLGETGLTVLMEIGRLSATNPKGESKGELSATNPKYILLESIAVSTASLVGSLGMPERTIRWNLNDLLRRGLVEKVGQRGGWKLTAEGERFISPTPQSQAAPTAADRPVLAGSDNTDSEHGLTDAAAMRAEHLESPSPHDSETAARCQLPPGIVEQPA